MFNNYESPYLNDYLRQNNNRDTRQQQNYGHHLRYNPTNIINFNMNNLQRNFVSNENMNRPPIKKNKTQEKFYPKKYNLEKQTPIQQRENYMGRPINMNDYRNQNNYNIYYNKNGLDIKPKNVFDNNNINNYNNINNNNFNNHNNNINNNNIINYNKNNINNNQMKIEKKLETPNPKPAPIPDFSRELLKALIYLYYFEKALSDKNESNLFYNSDKDFYLINPDFLKQFKNFYQYEEIKNWLEKRANYYYYQYIIKQPEIIESLINGLPKENLSKINVIWNDLKEFKKINSSASQAGNILYTKKAIIFPSTIMDIIKSFDDKVKNTIKPKKFIFNSNLVYYINNPNKIIIGSLKRDEAKFIPEYVFEFDNNVKQSEKDKIFNFPNNYSYINDYLIILIQITPPSSPAKNNKNNMNIIKKDNEIQKNIEPRKNIEMENQQKKKQEDLINININNLVNKINYLNEELKKKENQNQNSIKPK